jgi:hypothetical protein
MRSIAQQGKRVAALVGAPALALGVPVMTVSGLGGRPNGRGLPTVVHDGGLSVAGAAAIAAVIVAAIVVAVIGWRLDQRRVASRQHSEGGVETTATTGSRDPGQAGVSPSQRRVGGELAGARARRVASRDREERR